MTSKSQGSNSIIRTREDSTQLTHRSGRGLVVSAVLIDPIDRHDCRAHDPGRGDGGDDGRARRHPFDHSPMGGASAYDPPTVDGPNHQRR